MLLLFFALTELAHGFGFACSRNPLYRLNGNPVGNSSAIPVNLKIALIGDNNKETLELVLEEGAEFVVHAGDFDYEDDPALFERQINAVLGPNFPYIATMGNHDLLAFNGDDGYQRYLYDRIIRAGLDTECNGDVGVDFTCSYKGLLLVGTAVGTCYGDGYSDEDHINYVNEAMGTWGGSWKICHHHKNQRLYQTGTKTDETGYEILDTCRQHGAIMMTGHEHSYARTFEMSHFEDFEYDDSKFNPTLRAETLTQDGTTFLFVSGLGGESVRGWDAGRQLNPWWAATASDDGCTGPCSPRTPTNYGVFFCSFNYNGRRDVAHCYFKDINGRVFDEFDVTTQVPETPTQVVKKSECRSQWKEMSVGVSEDDIEISRAEGSPKVSIASPYLVASEQSVVQLTYNNIPLQQNAKLLGAWIQVYGEKASEGDAEIVISAIHNGEPATNSVVWTTDSEDWETHTVWISENIQSIVEEITAKSDWTFGDSITFTLNNHGASRKFFSFDANAWLAPALAVEVKSPCN